MQRIAHPPSSLLLHLDALHHRFLYHRSAKNSTLSPSLCVFICATSWYAPIKSPPLPHFLQHHLSSNKSMLLHNSLLQHISVILHDLKVYRSDDGHMQMLVAAFSKGLLDLVNDNCSCNKMLLSL